MNKNPQLHGTHLQKPNTHTHDTPQRPHTPKTAAFHNDVKFYMKYAGGKCVCVCVCVCASVCEREREKKMFVCLCERKSVCMCVWLAWCVVFV